MKTFAKIYIILIISLTACTKTVYVEKPAVQKTYVTQNEIYDYDIFYEELTPYGRWINYSSYGRVWIPKVSGYFAPYSTGGHWMFTEHGWMWMSDYNWGWAAFHYGNWLWDDYYGWVWVPGNRWAPAWVTWGYYQGYYGWAPIAPGIANYDNYRPPRRHWHFVHKNHFTDVNINNYIVNQTEINNINNVTIINNYNTYNNVKYNYGPKKEEIENATNQKIVAVPLKASDKPVTIPKTTTNAIKAGKTPETPVPIYRPEISKLNKDKNLKQSDLKNRNVEQINTVKPSINRSINEVNKEQQMQKPVYNKPETTKKNTKQESIKTGRDKPENATEKKETIIQKKSEQRVKESPERSNPPVKRPIYNPENNPVRKDDRRKEVNKPEVKPEVKPDNRQEQIKPVEPQNNKSRRQDKSNKLKRERD